MRQNKRETGRFSEQKAAACLKGRGSEILEINYRSRQGEIDLIAKDGETLVFVEVKFRFRTGSGHPSEAVDQKKQKRISRCALHYLTSRNLTDVPCRFDVVCICGEEGEPLLYQNAFDYQE